MVRKRQLLEVLSSATEEWALGASTFAEAGDFEQRVASHRTWNILGRPPIHAPVNLRFGTCLLTWSRRWVGAGRGTTRSARRCRTGSRTVPRRRAWSRRPAWTCSLAVWDHRRRLPQQRQHRLPTKTTQHTASSSGRLHLNAGHSRWQL